MTRLRRWACAVGLWGLLAGASAGADALAAPFPSSLVNTIETSRWSPPNPDPSGLAYDAVANRLLIVDGEVDEMAIFSGANYFETTLSGRLVRTATTTLFSREPVGLAFGQGRGVFIADDDQDAIFELALGPDGHLDPADQWGSFGTLAFGSADPEGVAYDRIGRRLFIADGAAAEIFTVSAVDGVFGNGDDRVTHFDTKALGVGDPETIEFDATAKTLYTIGVSGDEIVEVTTAGARLNEIDTSYLPIERVGGLAYAPSSGDARQRSFYVADRKADNDHDPDENDGTIYEVATDGSVAGRSGRYLEQALARGAVLTARCATACGVTARLYLRGPVADTAVAGGAVRLERAGRKRFRLEFTDRVRRRLGRMREVELSLRATLRGSDGEALRERAVLLLKRRDP